MGTQPADARLAEDPLLISTRADFARALAALKGSLPVNVVALRSVSQYNDRIRSGEFDPPPPITTGVLIRWLDGSRFPKTQEVMVSLLTACGAQPETFTLWLSAWDRLRKAPLAGQPENSV